MATLISSQQDFDTYIGKLKDNERCKFMTGLDLDLCNFDKYECRFRGEEAFSLRSGKRRECKRPRVLRLKRMLGSRNSRQ